MSRRTLVIVLLLLVLAIGVGAAAVVESTGRGNPAVKPPPPGPDRSATDYLAAWSKGDWLAMASLVDGAGPDFATIHQGEISDLKVVSATYSLVPPLQVHGDTADGSFRAHLRLRGLGDWDYTNRLSLTRRTGQWRVAWSPHTLFPDLGPGDTFARSRTVPARRDILSRDGTALTTQTSVVGIGIEPSHIKDRATVLATLARTLGVDPGQVGAALSLPSVRPNDFVPVEEVTDQAFVPLRGVLAPVPGIVFLHKTARLAATPDLSAHVVGHVGQPTAEQLAKLGDLYLPGDLVGLSGVEAAFESQLRGTPSGQVKVVDGTGATVAVAKAFPGSAGHPVATTLDLPTQQAAEKALAGITLPAAFVAVQPSTGDILAVVSRPLNAFDRALDGTYPPGSTFKVITSAALLGSGVTTDQSTTCPPSVTVDGKPFKNFEGEASASLPFHRAFALSCNTAFVQLADKLSPSDLQVAANEFGFGTTLSIGVPAIDGSYPLPRDAAEKVSSAIGQGRVTASPLQMATVAAAVDAGVWHSPHLVGPPPPDPGVPAFSADVDQSLQTLMAEVVRSGTGTAAAAAGTPVSGKTGTAEFGLANPPRTHAWFIGYSGDLAFSILVEGGGVGGRVAAPVAARFLTALLTPPPGQSGNGTTGNGT